PALFRTSRRCRSPRPSLARLPGTAPTESSYWTASPDDLAEVTRRHVALHAPAGKLEPHDAESGVAHARDAGFLRVDVQTGLGTTARASRGKRNQLVERVDARVAVVSVRVDQHVVEQRAAAFADFAERLDEVGPLFDGARGEVRVVRLITELRVDGLLVR